MIESTARIILQIYMIVALLFLLGCLIVLITNNAQTRAERVPRSRQESVLYWIFVVSMSFIVGGLWPLTLIVLLSSPNKKGQEDKDVYETVENGDHYSGEEIQHGDDEDSQQTL